MTAPDSGLAADLAALRKLIAISDDPDNVEPRIYDDEIDVLRALADAVERMQWRPIESAPKDGSDILVWCGPHSDPMWGIAHYDDEGLGWMMWWQADTKIHKWPEYWMPLPPPPATEGER